jgi:hypothetical protein
MEDWQREALAALLATKTTQVEEGTRIYVSSTTYGDSRYHLLSKKYDGIQLEQTNIEDKWGSRIHLQSDELPAVLGTLLIWYLEGVRPRSEEAAPGDDDSLGDLDEHPF